MTGSGVVPGGEPGATAPGARRGRPLAADRTDAILTAANDLFDEVGYDQLTVQDIAARAGVGLATLYRRWPTKHALLIDALRRRQERTALLLEGPPIEQLETLFLAIARPTVGEKSEFLPGLLAAIRSEESLGDDLRRGILDPLATVIRTRLEQVLGPDHPQMDLLVDLVPAVCVWKALAPTDPVDPDELVASVLALLARLAGDGPGAPS